MGDVIYGWPEDPENSLEYELMWIFIFITVALIPFCICWSLRIEVFGNCSGGQEGQQWQGDKKNHKHEEQQEQEEEQYEQEEEDLLWTP